MAPCIATGPREHYAFHVVSRGTALFAADAADPVELAAGDVVVLAPGFAHTLRSDPGAATRDVRELLAEGALCHPAGTRPGATQLVCGSFRFDDPHDAFRAVLPAVPHVRAAGNSAAPWLAWRMQKAAVLLRTERRSSEAIARHVGYDSPVAFAKTFKRVTGRPPGEYRRHARTG
ncbi:cupin domain-containing protein [Dactylosporangium sp. CA-139066]|uniref:AraC family transcriptional regulator n=1 Tax=Dactylosporangium sp. CA-139066 TaxID=3239930 RepID=UPI003D91BDA6